MNADEFLAALANSLDDNPPPARTRTKLRTATAWTSYMTERILDVAQATAAHVCARTISPGRKAHERSEYLFDFTFYVTDWKDYSLPIVLIEHENQWNEKAFLRDFWKLMFGYAPLRVMFGYTASTKKTTLLVERLRSEAAASSWKYPADTEDLVFIGHRGMGALDWRILHRACGSSDWNARAFPPPGG